MNSSIAIYWWSALSRCILKMSFSSKTLFYNALSPVFDQVLWKVLAKELNLREQNRDRDPLIRRAPFNGILLLNICRVFSLKGSTRKNWVQPIRFYLTKTLSQRVMFLVAVSLVVLFSATFFSMLHLYNVSRILESLALQHSWMNRFLIINSAFNLSLGLLRFN